ncbi:MAG: amidase [Anaerolineae bacterium]|jgi:amidase
MPNIDAFSSATDMLGALRAKQISAVELLDLHLARIARYNPQLNAIVTPNHDAARQAAQAADAARARDAEKPLLGLPHTLKDCIYAQGLPTTGGLPERAGTVEEEDAPVAARMRAAGGVLLGKTNIPPYAADWQSDNPVFGRSNNPWDLERTPGGSTGGGAAAVAAGLTPLEFGGDMAGSIRIPAAFCGIYGHKPSELVVPRRGHFPGPNVTNPATAMYVQGPLVRTAEDLELALDVISGADVGEDVAWRLELPPARHANLSDYRVAVLPPLDWVPVDDEIVAAQERLAMQLGQAGAQVQQTQPEDLGDLREYYCLFNSLLSALNNVGRPAEDCRREADEIRRHTDDPSALAWAAGLVASASDYVIWFGQREHYRAALRAFFRQWDILLAPANVVNAFPHDDTPQYNRQLEINGESASYDLQSVYASLCNLSGHPGTAFPAGQTRAGLPIGLQAVGPYLEDRTPIRFAALVAQALGGFCRPPGYD